LASASESDPNTTREASDGLRGLVRDGADQATRRQDSAAARGTACHERHPEVESQAEGQGEAGPVGSSWELHGRRRGDGCGGSAEPGDREMIHRYRSRGGNDGDLLTTDGAGQSADPSQMS